MSKPTAAPATEGTAIPAALEALLQRTIDERLFPLPSYPRQWFPDLDETVTKLFREAWRAEPAFRRSLADEAQAAGIMEAALGLPALLARHPRALVVIYRQMISGFIRRLHRRADERPDITQEVFARLLSGKLAQIQKGFDIHFNNAPSFTSYFMVCVRNIYMDIVREGRNLLMKRSDVPLPEASSGHALHSPASQSAFLDEEFARLQAILRMHPAGRDRIVLCLKLKCRLPVTSSDVRRCFPGCSEPDALKLRADYRDRGDREMYREVLPVFNRHSAKPIQADTLRKWVESKIGLLIAHLNRLHRGDVYDRKNILDLLGLFFGEGGRHGSS